jgi:hypothetical protein
VRERECGVLARRLEKEKVEGLVRCFMCRKKMGKDKRRRA